MNIQKKESCILTILKDSNIFVSILKNKIFPQTLEKMSGQILNHINKGQILNIRIKKYNI